MRDVNFNINFLIKMQYCRTEGVTSIIEDLLKEVQLKIRMQSLLEQIPAFATDNITEEMKELLHILYMPKHPLQMEKFKSQEIHDVPKISKDTLMPKDLSQEKGEQKTPQKLSSRSSLSSARKILGLSKRNSMTLTDKLRSISFTDQKLQKRLSKNISSKCQQIPQQNKDPQQQTPQVHKMREIAELRERMREQDIKFINEKQKHYKMKEKEYREMIGEQPDAYVTFDYDGETFRSTYQHDVIQMHKMRAGLGVTSKKFQEGFNVDEPEESYIEVRRNSREKGEGHRGPVLPMDMPILPMKFKDFGNNQMKNYKLQDYKKHYGKRYSRLESYGQTIDMNATTRTGHKQDLFSNKRHLKDDDNIPEARVSRMSGQQRLKSRRIALPRLHGKYKVLDRYQQI